MLGGLGQEGEVAHYIQCSARQRRAGAGRACWRVVLGGPQGGTGRGAETRELHTHPDMLLNGPQNFGRLCTQLPYKTAVTEEWPTFGGCGIVSVRRAKRSARLFFSSSALKAKLNCGVVEDGLAWIAGARTSIQR